MIVGLDIDGVLRDQVKSLTTQYLKDYPDHLPLLRPITSWGVHQFFPIGQKIYGYWFNDRVKEIMEEGFVYPGARDFVDKIRIMGHEVVLVTTQPKGTEHHTLFWVQKNDIPYDQFGFFGKKYLTDCDIYLDDAVHNLEELTRNDRRAVCYDQPYNSEWTGERVIGRSSKEKYRSFLKLLK